MFINSFFTERDKDCQLKSQTILVERVRIKERKLQVYYI